MATSGFSLKAQPDTGMNLLQWLVGNQESTTQSTNADVSGLREQYAAASSPMTQQLYDNLIASIFNTAAQRTPELSTALAGAIGTRSSNNSPLALALNKQNNDAAAAAAQAILTQQNTQRGQAIDAAKGIATGTTSTTRNTKTGAGMDPTVAMLGGMAMNYADKKGLFDKAGDWLMSGMDSIIPSTMSQPDLSYLANIAPSTATGFGGVGMDQAVSGANDLWSNFYLPSVDFSSAADLFSGVTGDAGSWLSDAGGAIADAGSGFLSWLGLADGGMPGQGLLRTRGDVIDAGERAAVAGTDPNAAMQEILRLAVSAAPTPAPTAVDPSLVGFLQYLVPMLGGQGIKRRDYADGGVVGSTDMMFADGGTPFIRNKNYMGTNLTRYGQSAFDGLTTGGGNGIAGITLGSNILGDMMQRNSALSQMPTTGEGASRTYRGKFTDQDFSDLKDTRDWWGGLAPGEANSLMGMLALAANPSIAGWVKLAYDGYQNSQKTMNAMEFYRDYLAVNSERDAAQEAQMSQNEQDAIAQMEAEAQAAAVAPIAPNVDMTIAEQYASYGGGRTGGNYTSPSDVDADVGADVSGAMLADGGLANWVITGPGNGSGTDDLIRARVSEPGGAKLRVSSNEMIIPTDTVAHFGPAFFQELINRTHTPVRR